MVSVRFGMAFDILIKKVKDILLPSWYVKVQHPVTILSREANDGINLQYMQFVRAFEFRSLHPWGRPALIRRMRWRAWYTKTNMSVIENIAAIAKGMSITFKE